jgi:NADH-quinone oxidoreductase subunit G
VASLPDGLWQSLGLSDGDRVRIAQGDGWVVLPARRDPTLAPGTVRVPAGHPDTTGLGAMAGTLHVERVTLGEGVEA